MPIIIDPVIRALDRIQNPALRKTAWFAALWLASVLAVGSFAYALRFLLKLTF